MIVDSLKTICPCLKNDPAYAAGFTFIEEAMKKCPENGKYPLEHGVYAAVSSYDTKPVEEKKFETHQNYIDIQVLLEGEERLDWAPAQSLETTVEYNPEKDVAFQKPTETSDITFVTLKPGIFSILYPEDGHRPGVMLNQPCTVKKVVIKVPVKK